MFKHTAIVALGSNLNEPAQQLDLAVAALKRLPATQVARVSSYYVTRPEGFLEQPDFVNAVVLLQTSLSSAMLLGALHGIEAASGRVRTFCNAPRVLDLDLIDHQDRIGAPVSDDTTTCTVCVDSVAPLCDNAPILPHPRAHLRGFVMIPLAEIAPDYRVGEHPSARELAALLARSNTFEKWCAGSAESLKLQEN